MPRTVVVHHRSGIGDLIWHIPYLRAIAARSEGGKVSVIARPSCKAAEVLAAEDCIDEVIEFDHRPRKGEDRKGRHDGLVAQIGFVRSLRARGFERIYIFSGRVRYALLAALAGIPQRAGFGFSVGERMWLTEKPFIRPYAGPGNWVYPEVTAFCVAHGLVHGPVIPRMMVLPAALEAAARDLQAFPAPRYAFSIGTSEPRKNWGAARFAQLAEALLQRGCSVVLLGGPAEAEAARRILDGLSPAARERILLSAQGSVQRSAALLRHSQFCLGNDTGVLNMAVANGVPSLGLFGATPPLAHDPLLKALLGDGMASIQPDDVLERLAELKAPAF
ncbi:glycosyltransferase family 9 protein [Zoogloea sp.]|uniref:glycosyltransferase family 9 protein n=1 Tax=Zoogloea sp. TaxID=49181 RepID=UPI0031FD32FD